MMKRAMLIGAVIAALVIVVAGVLAYAVLYPGSGLLGGKSGSGSGGGGSGSGCTLSAVSLGSSSSYAILASSSIASTGATSLTGNLGLSPGSSVTGFPPGTVTGTKDVANSAAASAKGDLTTAWNDAKGRSNCATTVAGNIGGQTLKPGLYTSTSTLAISSGDLTLDGQGNSNAVFIFQVASSLTTTSGRMVILTNGAQASNVFWEVGSSATLGTTSTLYGTILAYASVTIDTGATLHGRAMAETGSVVLQAATVTVP
jgi:ice-binding like protein